MQKAENVKLSAWPSFMLGAIGAAWLLQEAGFFKLALPLGPVAVIWASLTVLLLLRQLKR